MTQRRSATWISQVDEALEAYVRHSRARGREPQGFSPRTIRGYINRARSALGMSEVDYVQCGQLLQHYRVSQDKRRPNGQHPRYVIASRGYGRNARWFILAKPNSDPRSVREARLTQAEWSIEDMVSRWASDVAHELAPSLQGTAVDDIIADAVASVSGHLAVVRNDVERSLRRVAATA